MQKKMMSKMMFSRKIIPEQIRDSIELKILSRCNFNCSYCCNGETRSKKDFRLTVEDIDIILKKLSAFDGWEIRFSGGEPFLHPDIISFSKKFSKRFKIGFETNLSQTSKIHELVRCVPPERVSFFNVSIHMLERERLGNIDELIDNILFLKDRGYDVRVNYVLFPELTGRFQKDYDFFKSKGIIIEPKPFQGIYASKWYPAAHSRYERHILKKYNLDHYTRNLVFSKGVSCTAGINLMKIDSRGKIFRCSDDPDNFGKIGTGIFLLDRPKRCNSEYCCYGDKYIERSFKNYFLRLRNNILLFFKQNIKRK